MAANETDLLLTPFPPMSLGILSDDIDLSRVIGDIPMINILSAKTKFESKFTLIDLFSTEVWICFLFAYVLISSVKSFHCKDWNIFFTYLGIIFRQNSGIKSNIDFIQLVWIVNSFILMSGFSGIIMSSLVMKPTFQTIETLEELAKSGISFSVFEGETADELISDSKEPYCERLRQKVIVEDVQNDRHEEWNREIVAKIASGKFALVSDAAFAKYLLSIYIKNYTNLHQSSELLVNLPYFMLIRKTMSDRLKSLINKM